jgi:ABC-2 type transport system ATP-binding protein
VIADDTAARLKANLAGDLLTFGFTTDADAERAVSVIEQLTDREVRREAEASVVLTAPEGDALLPAAVRALDAAGLRVQRATGVPPTLDDVFLALTGRTLREAGEGEPVDEESEAGAGQGEGPDQKKGQKASAEASGAAQQVAEKTGANR